MKKILLLCAHYWPGFRGGGPIQSHLNLVEALGDEFHFLVLTSDRDHRMPSGYEQMPPGQWISVGHAQVCYLPPGMKKTAQLFRNIRAIRPDLIYLSGFFPWNFTIKTLLLKRLGRLSGYPILLAPRGDFTGGMATKRLKKRAFVGLSKLLRLCGGIQWHSTSALETRDISAVFSKAIVHQADNITTTQPIRIVNIDKNPGQLRLIFVSRIAQKKNLLFALRALGRAWRGRIVFDIYGPIDDKPYWRKCLRCIRALPPSVTVNYLGETDHESTLSLYPRYHAFFFPTLGENFGHVIAESLRAGCPVILPRGATPWNFIDPDGGMLVAPGDMAGYVRAIGRLLDMDQMEYDRLREGAVRCAIGPSNRARAIADTRRMLLRASEGGRVR